MAVNQKTNQTKHTVRNAGIGRSLASKGILGTCKYLFLLLIILISIGPIIWAFLSSFKTYAEINASAISLPKSFNLNNYADAFRYAPIQKYFLNSIIIVGISVVVTVCFVAMCAYIVARYNFKMKTISGIDDLSVPDASGTGNLTAFVLYFQGTGNL